MNRDIKLHLESLIKRSDNLVNEACLTENEPYLTEIDIQFVEKELGVILSPAFRKLNAIFRYDYSSAFEFLNFQTKTEYSVIGETLKLRQFCNLPTNYVVLAIQDDVTAVLLETASGANKENKVFFCTIYDLQNVYENGEMVEDTRIFPTFTDFFRYLLDEEEKQHNKERNHNT